jgi:broad specificity phosphatase PhoE
METLIVFRHGKSELNLRSELTGKAAEQAFQEGLAPDIDTTAGLIPEGLKQAHKLQRLLAEVAIDSCFSSSPLRARQTAEIGLAGKIPPEDFIIADELIERDRGLFRFLPDEIAKRLKKEHPEYWEEPDSTLRRRPKDGETLLEVMDRLLPIVLYADAYTPGGTVAFSTHAETMTAIRALVGRLNDDELAAPLVPYPSPDILPLQRANWNDHCQTDVYTRRNPFDGNVAPYMTHFQSIGVDPVFYTGWRQLPPPAV